jgi:hypothetical protein
VEFAIDIQPRPTRVKIASIRPGLVRRIFLFSGLLLELMVIPGIVTDRLKIEQRNAVSKPLVQKEVVFADALKREERAVQQQILFIVEPLHDLVQTLFRTILDTKRDRSTAWRMRKSCFFGTLNRYRSCSVSSQA